MVSFQAEAALREARVGDTAQARQQAAAAMKMANGRDTEAAAALAFALASDAAQAQKLAADLAKRFPQDTIAQFNYPPTHLASKVFRRACFALSASAVALENRFTAETRGARRSAEGSRLHWGDPPRRPYMFDREKRPKMSRPGKLNLLKRPQLLRIPIATCPAQRRAA